jgi:drug/metabolite transporter (DMT)-like permease
MSAPAGHIKTRLFTAAVVLANVLGNLSLSWGLKQPGAVLTAAPLSYLKTLFTPWVAAGLLLLIVWMLSRMALLSWADLSYVLPVTAMGYVMTVVAGKVFLLEQVSWQRWTGSLLVMAGVAIVSSTPVRTRTRGGAHG